MTLINKEKLQREVYCSLCKAISISNEPFPKCPIHKIPLVKVVRNVLSNEIITGATK